MSAPTPPDDTAVWIARGTWKGRFKEYEFPCYALPWMLPRINRKYARRAVRQSAIDHAPFGWADDFQIVSIIHKATGKRLDDE